SCGAMIAASRYRLSRYWGVVGPPIGSVSVKPADALAPIITIRPHGGFGAGAAAGADVAAVGFCVCCAWTASPSDNEIAVIQIPAQKRRVMFRTVLTTRENHCLKFLQ